MANSSMSEELTFGELTCEEDHPIGIESLISVRIFRGDEELEQTHENVETIIPDSAHNPNYADKNGKIIPEQIQEVSRQFSPTPEPSKWPTFDFKNHCFFCAKPVDFAAITKCAIKYRRKVSKVTNHKFQETILNSLQRINDSTAREVISRIENIPDLTLVEACYHKDCWIAAKRPKIHNRRGRPISNDVDRAMDHVYRYIEENSDECQFTMKELEEAIEIDSIPERQTTKQRLRLKYGNGIFISEGRGIDPMVCLTRNDRELLSRAFYEEKKPDLVEERARVVREAAAIVLEDIRSRVYNTKTYPISDADNRNDLIPSSLETLLSEIIMKSKKESLERWKNKCSYIAHAIISAVRPRSFISTLKFGLGALLYKKFGSERLIDVLSSLGICSSWEEITRFDVAAITRPRAVPKMIGELFDDYEDDDERGDENGRPEDEEDPPLEERSTKRQKITHS